MVDKNIIEGACSVEFDSRKVKPSSIFVATVGTVVDGHNFIEDAIDKGATVVVCERIPASRRVGVSYVQVEDSYAALAEVAAEFFGHPSSKLKLVGVTGTNGKTTTATLLHDMFGALGHKSGLLSTVVNKIGEQELPSTHTTPDPVELNCLLDRMVAQGCEYCFMEVSSHSLVQKRVHALQFAGGIFTNLTHDHLDYHGTFAKYLEAKKSFFDTLPATAFALTNADDRNGEVMLQNCAAEHRSYSLRSMATYNGRVVEEHLDGMQLRINGSDVWVQFIGRFNAYNLLSVYGAALELGIESTTALQTLSTLRSVSGRFEVVHSADGRVAIVDYAHTPDALKNVLDTIAELSNSAAGAGAARGTAGAAGAVRVITVVGCGGDRDTTKRPIMARIAAQGSTQLILTSDNPRTEDPALILSQMADGLTADQLRHTLIIEDRKQAILTAATIARAADVILIAGKGHENYQERNGVRTHFDDKEVIVQCFDAQ